MAFFRTYVSQSIGGTGRYQALADINMTRAQALSVGGGFPGETGVLWGCLFQLVQNRSGGDLALGDAVSLYFGAAARIGNLTGASTPAVLTTDDTLDAYLAGSEQWPGIVGVTAGAFATTADETWRQIMANSTAAGASTITIVGGPTYTGYNDGPTHGVPTSDPDAIGTLAAPPDATYDYEAFCPWEVVKADVDAVGTATVQGIVRSTTISNGNLGAIQITGPCLAKVDGTTDLASGDPLIADAAAGILSKGTLGTNDAYFAGRILGAYTNNGVGLRLVLLTGRTAVYPFPINW